MDAPNASCGETEEGGERNTVLLFSLLTFLHPNTILVAGGGSVMIPNII